MCRSIVPLFNFAPPATEAEVRAAALQFVRKVSGYRKASALNAAAFDLAIEEIARATGVLVDSLVTNAEPRNRDEEIAKRREKFAARRARG